MLPGTDEWGLLQEWTRNHRPPSLLLHGRISLIFTILCMSGCSEKGMLCNRGRHYPVIARGVLLHHERTLAVE
jgi:hypothetical protein